MKMPEVYCSVNFIVINVFGRFVMELDLADPNFADFRSNSACVIFGPRRYVGTRRNLRNRFNKLVGHVRTLRVPARRIGALK